MRQINENCYCNAVGLCRSLGVDFCGESSCSVGVSYVYMQRSKQILSLTMEFHNVFVVREISIFSLFHHLLFFNVILQDLGPIGQNYLLVVCVFGFLNFDLMNCFPVVLLICRFAIYKALFFHFRISRIHSQNTRDFEIIFKITVPYYVYKRKKDDVVHYLVQVTRRNVKHQHVKINQGLMCLLAMLTGTYISSNHMRFKKCRLSCLKHSVKYSSKCVKSNY